MRLIIMGQQAFGKDVLQKILIRDVDEVVAVYCEPDKEKKPIDVVKEVRKVAHLTSLNAILSASSLGLPNLSSSKYFVKR